MNLEIRQKRNALRKDSMSLRSSCLSINNNYEKQQKILEKQDEMYKKFVFYDNLIKTMEKN